MKTTGLKTIGLIGGLSWHSTGEYYRIINEEVQRRLGAANSARLIIYSFNFQDIVDLGRQDRAGEIRDQIIAAGKTLQRAGADLIMFATNTIHRYADEFQASVSLPLIHI